MGGDVNLDTGVGDQRVVNLSSDLYDFFFKYTSSVREREGN